MINPDEDISGKKKRRIRPKGGEAKGKSRSKTGEVVIVKEIADVFKFQSLRLLDKGTHGTFLLSPIWI